MSGEFKILNEEMEFILLEGKMQNELISQLRKSRKFKDHEIETIARNILDVDPTRKKTWRTKIKDWVISGEIKLDEDGSMLTRDLEIHTKSNLNKKDFDKRSDLAEYIENFKKNKGVEDNMFNYTFDIDYNDSRFTIYHIQEQNKTEYIEKLGKCTTWCVTTDKMFGYYPLPYYLLVDKKEKKQYAIVPSGGQFRDSKQNEDNSKKRFEDFDKILNLRERYYSKHLVIDSEISDIFIYDHPTFDKYHKVKLSAFGFRNDAYIDNKGRVCSEGYVKILDRHVENGKLKFKFGKVGSFDC
jgi:hypothetical protein